MPCRSGDTCCAPYSIEDFTMAEERNQLSEHAIIQLQKLHYDHEIARLGLKGTLWGSWAALATIILVVVAQVVTEREIVKSSHLVWIVGILTVCVISYGIFIFDRALRATA